MTKEIEAATPAINGSQNHVGYLSHLLSGRMLEVFSFLVYVSEEII